MLIEIVYFFIFVFLAGCVIEACWMDSESKATGRRLEIQKRAEEEEIIAIQQKLDQLLQQDPSIYRRPGFRYPVLFSPPVNEWRRLMDIAQQAQ